MTHTYNITGMTCNHCVAKVQGMLSKVPGVKTVSIQLEKGLATIEMGRHIATDDLKLALKDYPQYDLTEENTSMHEEHLPDTVQQPSWLATYKPILLIFAFILGISLLVEMNHASFEWMRWMEHFMAGFFLAFSFFKLLDIQGFADSYSTYDIIAKRWRAWGYIYPFVELGLGIAFLTGISPLLTNMVTFMVMSVSIIGVLQSVLNKRKIRCACLGAVFNLPMSTVTIIEDALMILMSAVMLITLL